VIANVCGVLTLNLQLGHNMARSAPGSAADRLCWHQIDEE